MTGAGAHAYPRIWNAVLKIPKGRVSTYGWIARLAGMRGHARMVGYALHRLPMGMEIPWHRVINAAGRISLPKRGGHYDRQRRLLEREGIRFVRDRVDLRLFGWPRHRSHRRQELAA